MTTERKLGGQAGRTTRADRQVERQAGRPAEPQIGTGATYANLSGQTRTVAQKQTGAGDKKLRANGRVQRRGVSGQTQK